MKFAFSARARAALATRICAAMAAIIATVALSTVPAAAVDIVKVTSPGGIKAWVVVDKTTPIITVSFAFQGGAIRDPNGKEGLAVMVGGLLDQGAGDMDARALQSKLQDLSIRFSMSAGRDDFNGSLRTLGENRDVAFRLLSDILAKPRFDAAAVERVRRQLISAAIRSTQRPRRIANRTWMARAFPNHPYGRPTSGTAKSLAAITQADLKAMATGAFARDNLVVGVVGNIDPKDVGKWLDTIFGALPAKSTPLTVKKVAPKLDGKVDVVRFNVPQSQIVFGQAGIAREDKDFYPAFVMNHILGAGSFTARLYMEVREKRGLAYGVSSYLLPLDYTNLFMGSTATTNEKASESIRIIRQQWELMAKNGVTKAELAAAKKYLTGAYPLRFSESSGLARMLVGVQLVGLETDFFDKRNSYVEAVTVEDIKRVAKRLLNEKRLTFVVVGAPAGR